MAVMQPSTRLTEPIGKSEKLSIIPINCPRKKPANPTSQNTTSCSQPSKNHITPAR